MADLHNPLFEDEKEFLERQKQEYERALIGDVEEIKAKTQEVSKYVAIGAGVLGGIWLLSKAFGGKKKRALNNDEEYERHQRRLARGAATSRRPVASTNVDSAVTDDLGFGSGHHQYDRGRQPASGRAHLAPDVYHTDTDEFDSLGLNHRESSYASRSLPVRQPARSQEHNAASSVVASAFRSFLESDTGKVLVAQASAVLMAYVAKKASEYLPMLKNPDLAASAPVETEPETRDIEFTFHDDADAPHQPV